MELPSKKLNFYSFFLSLRKYYIKKKTVHLLNRIFQERKNKKKNLLIFLFIYLLKYFSKMSSKFSINFSL